ncbi:hypothetical protein B0T26DRAFT_754432 [Lasiosphaeria miniovina]|uniref:Uncharacterized protein n=1 Tax=Lasiosphaeria miniovina TaxID=1954250 RepID=A0AA40A4U3_9PEZI|nr:uncharacterized protein B0T26DRAFT_754432 [Lasiosphaeria miniovina]KAK0709183.1 hypothetical protein B0T26DRAFT_754432 [Lasiosphaeria miniovina]
MPSIRRNASQWEGVSLEQEDNRDNRAQENTSENAPAQAQRTVNGLTVPRGGARFGNINTTRIIRGITNPGFIWSTGFNPQGARVSRRHYKGINTRCIDSSHYEGFGCSI